MSAAAHDTRAPKRATNVSVSEDLLAKARAANINLSATLERALEEVLRKQQREQWLAENKQAMANYNAHVEKRGVFSEGTRSF